jgi:hypothetical protein
MSRKLIFYRKALKTGILLNGDRSNGALECWSIGFFPLLHHSYTPPLQSFLNRAHFYHNYLKQVIRS